MKNNNDISVYMKQVCRYKLLNREEELKFAQQAQAGDEEAREKLIVSNLRFVVQIANKYITYTKSGKYTVLDLIQEGNDGLIHAVKRFDPSKGYRFTTYSIWWIRAKIMNFIIQNHSMVKIGTTAKERKLFFKMSLIKDLLSTQDSEQKEEARRILAETANLSEDDIKEMEERVYWHDQSIETPLSSSISQTNQVLGDLISVPSHAEDYEQSDMRQKIQIALSKSMHELTDREKDIIQMRWLSDDGATLQTIANKYGLSRERIRQIETKIFDEMRKLLKNEEVTKLLVEEVEE